MAEQPEKAFIEQPKVFLCSKKSGKGRGPGKGGNWFWKSIGLGFKIPREAIQRNYLHYVKKYQRWHPADLILRLLRSIHSTRPGFSPKYKLSSATVAPTVSCSGVAGLPPIVDARRRKNHRFVTGTLYGYRNGRVSLALQEDPCCLPSLVIELASQTHALLREMSAGMVRIALESKFITSL